MGYIKDLANLDNKKCALCQKQRPKLEPNDVECDHCGAEYHSQCCDPQTREVSINPRVLGRLIVRHAEFVCPKCGQSNLWHDNERWWFGGFMNLKSGPCTCS